MHNLSDFHTHSHFSDDSSAVPEENIKQAIKLGLSSICFTEHNDFEYPYVDGQVMFLVDFDKYYNCVYALKKKYEDIIKVNIGVEQGLYMKAFNKIEEYDKDNLLDFIIGSSHLVNGEDPYYKEFWENCHIKESIKNYYECILENVTNFTNYDVYGHIDYIIRYIPDKSYQYNVNDYMDIISEILKTLINKGKGIEINTGGIRYGLPDPNPCYEILKRFKELGGEIITTGSDAHYSKDIGSHFSIIHNMLTEAGFKYYCEFNQRKPSFIKI